MGSNYGKGNAGLSAGYVGAPYNFVPFAKKPFALDEKNRVPHNAFAEEKIDGEIRYHVTAKTPIFVSDGYEDAKENQHPDFARNQYGEYAIPGNTMRGLVRNNLQILSESSFADDIDDYRMMFREVAGGADRIDRKRYASILGASILNIGDGKQVSILKYVKAGYITKENGKYYICRTERDSVEELSKPAGGLNYYIVSEKFMIDSYVDNGFQNDDFSFFFNDAEKYLQHKPDMKFRKVGQGKGTKFINDENPEYIPYFSKVAYKVSGNGRVTSVKADSPFLGNDYRKGYAISSGPMKNKKVIYIIPQRDDSLARIDIGKVDPGAIRAYQIDYEKRKNGLKPVRARKNKEEKGRRMQEFFDLPKEGQCKPVFYIEHGGLYFGYTPRLRLFDDYTIKDGMNAEQKEQIFDYSKSLFGYSSKDACYKTRLSFSDAVMTKEGSGERRREGVILAEPKPSSFADYLVQDGERITKTYNSDNFELRGVKQYWLHDKPATPSMSNKENVKSSIYPLSDGTEFEGVVRFSNLSIEELGLLLWSIRLDKNSQVNIGQGKSFGYGVSKVDVLSVKKFDRAKAYDPAGEFVLDAFDDTALDADALIDGYKKKLEERIGKKISSDPSLRAFLLMKNSSVIPDESLVRYMSIDAGEYRNRTALKSVQDTVDEGRNLKERMKSGNGAAYQVQNASSGSYGSYGKQSFSGSRGGHGSYGSNGRQSGDGEGNRKGGGKSSGGFGRQEVFGRGPGRVDAKTVTGKVKFVSHDKGFGFIKAAGLSDDIYFRIEKFPDDEQQTVSSGKKVEAIYIQGQRGPQTVECRLLD